MSHEACRLLALNTSCGSTAKCRKESFRTDLKRGEHQTDGILDHRITLGIGNQNAGKRADLHGVVFPAGGLEPAVLFIGIEMFKGRLWSGIFRSGLSLPWVKSLAVTL